MASIFATKCRAHWISAFCSLRVEGITFNTMCLPLPPSDTMARRACIHQAEYKSIQFPLWFVVASARRRSKIFVGIFHDSLISYQSRSSSPISCVFFLRNNHDEQRWLELDANEWNESNRSSTKLNRMRCFSQLIPLLDSEMCSRQYISSRVPRIRSVSLFRFHYRRHIVVGNVILSCPNGNIISRLVAVHRLTIRICSSHTHTHSSTHSCTLHCSRAFVSICEKQCHVPHHSLFTVFLYNSTFDSQQSTTTARTHVAA